MKNCLCCFCIQIAFSFSIEPFIPTFADNLVFPIGKSYSFEINTIVITCIFHHFQYFLSQEHQIRSLSLIWFFSINYLLSFLAATVDGDCTVETDLLFKEHLHSLQEFGASAFLKCVSLIQYTNLYIWHCLSVLSINWKFSEQTIFSDIKWTFSEQTLFSDIKDLLIDTCIYIGLLIWSLKRGTETSLKVL